MKRKWIKQALLMLMTMVLSLSFLPKAYGQEGAEECFEPDFFQFSGGTGKLQITCPQVSVRDGQAWAVLVFSSGHIIYVVSGEETFYPEEQTEKTTTFEIPVLLNEEQEIIGCTTAMSTPHEISYTIYVGTGEIPEDMKLSEPEEFPEEEDDISSEQAGGIRNEDAAAPEMEGLVFEKQTDFLYAQCVDVYYYEGGYKYIRVYDSADYLLVPEDKEIPEGLDDSVIILSPPQNIYMAATGAMALLRAAGGMDFIGFSSVTAENWYVEEAKTAMEEGKILYAGKYSAPDFELLVSLGCDLAVESTMILHTPKVQEMLEQMGIPVFIDRSSYELHPLGRTEWVKVYGAILDQEEEAESFFAGQVKVLDELSGLESTGKTVAFFYINMDGSVVVRRPGDSVPQMIALAGGKYVLDDAGILQETRRSSVSITMEEFYANAVNADYLIYNSSIASPIHTLEDLLDKSPLFADFKAVKDGNVWCADKYLYQATDIVGQLIMDFYHMLHDGEESLMTFLYRIN